jgi:hypothetical protein
MGVEAAIETGIKTALQAFTDTLAYDVHYRCFWLDDAATDDEERLVHPRIEITAAPNTPTHHGSGFRDTQVEARWVTHIKDDPKRATLRAMYEGCRDIIDADTTFSFGDYHRIAIMIDEGGEADIDGHDNYIMLPLVAKICGA